MDWVIQFFAYGIAFVLVLVSAIVSLSRIVKDWSTTLLVPIAFIGLMAAADQTTRPYIEPLFLGYMILLVIFVLISNLFLGATNENDERKDT